MQPVINSELGYIFFPTLAGKFKKTMQRRLNECLKPHSLSSMYALYLVALDCSPQGMTQKELTESVGADKANTARVTAALLEKGYVRRQQDDERPSKNIFTLTEAGSQAARDVRDTLDSFSKAVFSDVTEAERDMVRSLLERFYYAIERM